MIPHSLRPLAICSPPPPILSPPSLFYLTSLSMAGPSVEHESYRIEMLTAPRGPPVGMVGCYTSTTRKGSQQRIHYISVMEHPIVKVHLVIKSEISSFADT